MNVASYKLFKNNGSDRLQNEAKIVHMQNVNN